MFTNIPNNYSSMWGELIFEYNSSTESDVVINIYDALTSTLLGVKIFYSCSSAKITIAPLIFDSMFPSIEATPITYVNNPISGFPRIVLFTDSTSTEELIFTYSKSAVAAPMFLTTMPLERIIYAGEQDRVVVIAPEDSSISYKIAGTKIGEEESQSIYTGVPNTKGRLKIFTFVASDYAEDYETIEATFFYDQVEIGTVRYSLNSEQSTGYRLAWLSSHGSIEQYTFPIIASKSRLSSGATALSLRSAYGREQEIEALSEIVSAAKVWHFDTEKSIYKEVEVTTTEQYIRQEGALSIINIEVQEYD